jgi:hypothetical protein
LHHLLRISRYVLFGLVLLTASAPARGASLVDVPISVSNAAAQLVKHCNDCKTSLDEQAVDALVEFVLKSKDRSQYSLPKSSECYGAYYEFDTKISFPRFTDYSYSSLIPSIIVRPSTLRSSVWSNPGSEMHEMPASWPSVPPAGPPVIIRGLQRDTNTPDPTTGVYHQYDLRRTLILLNHKGRQVLISVSKQADQSAVGRKGVIVGDDSDWTYYYSNEPGTTKTGLGWAKSYIYDYFSVAVYIESEGPPAIVKTGAFQWLRAGWLGINLVKPIHIIDGMKRYADCSRTVLESPHLPAPGRLSSVYQALSNMPASELTRKYAALQQALRSSAIRTGKIGKAQPDERQALADPSREQMVEELMLEYLRTTLGKPTALGKQSFLTQPVTSQ